MIRRFLNIALLFVVLQSAGQDNQILAELKSKLAIAQHDTERTRILVDIVDNTYDYSIWPQYNDRALALAEKNLPNSDPFQDTLFKKYKGYALNNKGIEVEYEGNRIEALSYYQKSLAIHKSIGFKKGMSSCMNNIGSLLYDQGEHERAIDYYNRSIKIKKELGYKKGLAWTYMNVGSLHDKLNDADSALYYFNLAYGLHAEIDNQYGKGAAAHNIGSILAKYKDQQDEALKRYRESLKCYTITADSTGISWELGVIGIQLFKRGEIDSAFYYINESMRMAEDNGYLEGISAAATHLVKIYESLKDYEKAYQYKQLELAIEDSVQSNKVEQEILKKELKFVHEQEKMELEKEREKEAFLAQERDKRQQIIIIGVLVGLVIVGGFLILLFQRFQKEKEQKAEIAKQRDEIEEKNTEIVDSITYAQRIQYAILKGDEPAMNTFEDHFVLFQPKDIVSGDFYWTHQSGDDFYLAVADCTGHGVPGALMSMLGVSLLNDIVNDNHNISVDQLLNQLRNRVIKELSQHEEDSDSRDGMDISLIKINLKSLSGEWAGANNPLWILRQGSGDVEEIKPDKQPIGYYMKMEPFAKCEIQLDKGDQLYMFSDGYADQFGGLKGKKLKYTAFKELIIKNAKEEHSMQRLLLKKFFENWRGEIEQIDDICVMGVKL